MRLRQIEVFHAVYSNGSISAAARSLHVSQPAVSKVLRHTESQLGIRLFELVRGRLVPTDEAHALFREVDEVFQRISSLQLATSNLRKSGAGHLRVGAVPSLGLDIVPAAVAGFRAQHPDVTFDIKTLHHHDMLRALYERECDLAIAYAPPVQPRLEQQLLTQAQLVLVAPRGRFDSGDGLVDLTRLDGIDMIGVTTSGPIGAIVADALALAQVEPREVASVSTYYVAAALVRHGVGVAIMDEYTGRAMANQSIDVLPLSPATPFGVHAVWLEDRPLSKLGVRFVKLVQRILNQQTAR
ncbi:LysR family transcriptional regulator [Sphingomonas lacunae]|uniref:LysR family transcriptional regulator n=1 Tax=Sphingomonas lacunae TaxID=2698828 RepID=A0A6M4AX15_9SPHN|nr:LysR family transcriptional regulator [Sphingomonas lacunae]QJQ32589.1 LysR family transcriptional regulator [Sphingomonas lacunae]